MLKIIVSFAFCLTLLLQNADSKAQNINKTYIPFDSVINKLEIKYNIKFFYNPAWFKERNFYSQIADLPLKEALELLTNESHLSLTNLNDIYYVFVPFTETKSHNSEKEKILIVGDALNYGSKTNVKVTGKVVDYDKKKTTVHIQC